MKYIFLIAIIAAFFSNCKLEKKLSTHERDQIENICRLHLKNMCDEKNIDKCIEALDSIFVAKNIKHYVILIPENCYSKGGVFWRKGNFYDAFCFYKSDNLVFNKERFNNRRFDNVVERNVIGIVTDSLVVSEASSRKTFLFIRELDKVLYKRVLPEEMLLNKDISRLW